MQQGPQTQASYLIWCSIEETGICSNVGPIDRHCIHFSQVIFKDYFDYRLFSLKSLIPFRIWPQHKKQFHCTNYSLQVEKMAFVPHQLTESVCFGQATKKEVYHRQDRKRFGHGHQSSEHLASGSEIPQMYSEIGIGNGRCILIFHFTTQDSILSVEQKFMEKS